MADCAEQDMDIMDYQVLTTVQSAKLRWNNISRKMLSKGKSQKHVLYQNLLNQMSMR